MCFVLSSLSFSTTSKLNIKSKQTNNKKSLSPFISLFLSPGTQRPQDELSIDWSIGVLEAPVTLQLCVSLAGVHMSLPHGPSGTNGNRGVESNNSTSIVLNYGNDQPAIISSWDRVFQALSVFRTEYSAATDTKSIQESIHRVVDYIKHHLADKKVLAGDFVPIVKSL